MLLVIDVGNSNTVLGLYQGEPGARSFRRTLSEARPGAGLETLDRALEGVERRAA